MTTKIVKSDGTVLDAGNVLSCTYHSAVNAGTEITLGSACSDYIEVSFWGDPGIGTGETLIYYRVAEDGTETRIGAFIAQKPTAVSDNVYRVLAYDFMVRFETSCADWLARTAFPEGIETYTLNDFAAAVCAACGIVYAGPGALLNGEYPVRPFALEQGTFRQLIQWIAEAGGCYAHMDPAGALTFGWYTPAELSASPDWIYSQSREDYTVSPVDALGITTAAGETVAGAGTNVYTIDGNPLFAYSPQSELQAPAEAILARLGALTYTPAAVTLRDNTVLRAGDLVTVSTGKSETYTLAVMELSLSGGAMKLSATGSQSRDTPAAVSAQSRSYTKAQQLRDTGKLIQEALVTAQADIRGQNGGVRVDHTDSQGRVYETLYLDTMSEDTAVNVMRLNSQGIGFSTNGVNGDFTMALTIDGGLANQWIRTWELAADVITSGKLMSPEADNKMSRAVFDLDNGFVYVDRKYGTKWTMRSLLNGYGLTISKIDDTDGSAQGLLRIEADPSGAMGTKIYDSDDGATAPGLWLYSNYATMIGAANAPTSIQGSNISIKGSKIRFDGETSGLMDLQTASATVTIGGLSVPVTFTKSGKVVVMTLSATAATALTAARSGTMIQIPAGFEPSPEQVTGDKTTAPLWGRGSYKPSIIGSLSLWSQSAVRVYWDTTNPTVGANWTIGGTMTWITA